MSAVAVSSPLWFFGRGHRRSRPGPNNIQVLSSGLTYGFRRSLTAYRGHRDRGFIDGRGPWGLGLGAIFIAYPVLQTILKYLGIA